MANIRDVARLAGVSISSVSNFLNNRSRQLSSHTCQRIEEAISALGYAPRPVEAASVSKPTKVIGLLLPSILNPSFSALAHAIEGAARMHRYRVLLGNAWRQEQEEAAFIDDMLAIGARGVIVAASDVRQTHFLRAAKSGIKIVSYDNQFAEHMDMDARQFDSVSMDNRAAGRMAALHLIERGCNNLLFATEETLTAGRNHKIEGFLSTQGQHRHVIQQHIIEGRAIRHYGDTEMFDLGMNLAREIIARSPKPDGIVAINDALGIGLITGLRLAGIKIPGEISIIGIDNISLSDLSDPSLSSIKPPLEEMARLMIERIVNNEPKIGEFLFPPTLICRQSVREKSK